MRNKSVFFLLLLSFLPLGGAQQLAAVRETETWWIVRKHAEMEIRIMLCYITAASFALLQSYQFVQDAKYMYVLTGRLLRLMGGMQEVLFTMMKNKSF